MQYLNSRNLRFLLHEFLDLSQLQKQQYFADFDPELADMALDAARQLSDQYLFPFYRVMDQEKAYYKDGRVYVKAAVGEGMQALGQNGWLSANWTYDQGGQQMPLCLLNAGLFTFYAANGNIASYGFLTAGAGNLIRNFGSQELQDLYLPKMMTGEWQGTMALTEPQAGSSLSDITTSATPLSDGSYAIKGQKIYISGGDHDSTENVIHLLLARHHDGPAGTKGVSLFVVPKFRLEEGELIDNHVTTAGIYGKMGQKGYVAAHLMYGEQGETKGYLVGTERRGLNHMFQMMNEARIGTGLMAAGTASAAYYASLQYANERPQGRHVDDKDVSKPQILIIEHADVRRMLLMQKAVVEGSIALLLQCSYYADLAEHADDESDRHHNHLLLELLTPIAKSYPRGYGTLATSNGMQVLGGAGYCDDFPLEQYYRDIRVNSIYEGTTTIHGMDILGRKVVMEDGKALKLLHAEILETIAAAQNHPEAKALAEELQPYLAGLQKTLAHLMGLAKSKGSRAYLADATVFLDYFSHLVLAWVWLKQVQAAEVGLATAEGSEEIRFYRSKLQTAHYFYAYELPKVKGWQKTLLDDRQVSLHTDPADII